MRWHDPLKRSEHKVLGQFEHRGLHNGSLQADTLRVCLGKVHADERQRDDANLAIDERRQLVVEALDADRR